MKSLKIKHYAKAIVEIGTESNCFEDLIADLADVSEKLNEHLDLKTYLSDKQLAMTKKTAALEKVFQDFIGKRTKNFLSVLIKNQHLEYLDEIIDRARKLNLEFGGVSAVTVASVVALTGAQEQSLEKIVSEKMGRPVILKNIIDEALIGGIRIATGDLEVDCSILGKIERLKKTIEQFE